MKILKHRTIAHVYPHLSFEAEVLLADGRTVYANISVNKDGKKEEYCEDSFWVYNIPLTEVLFEAVDNYYADLAEDEMKEIAVAMLEIWNANPVFVHELTWKEVIKEDEGNKQITEISREEFFELTCSCGNIADWDGFIALDSDLNEIDISDDSSCWTGYIKCYTCGKIYKVNVKEDAS